MSWAIAATVPYPLDAYGDLIIYNGWLYQFGGILPAVEQNAAAQVLTGVVQAWPISPIDGSLGAPSFSELPVPLANTYVEIYNGFYYTSGFGYGSLTAFFGPPSGLVPYFVGSVANGKTFNIPAYTSYFPDINIIGSPLFSVMIGNNLWVQTTVVTNDPSQDSDNLCYIVPVNPNGSLGTWQYFPSLLSPSLPTPSNFYGGPLLIGNFIYFVGGQLNDSSVTTNIYRITVDPVSGQPQSSWSLVGNTLVARYRAAFAAVTSGNQTMIVCAGGSTSGSVSVNTVETLLVNPDGSLQAPQFAASLPSFPGGSTYRNLAADVNGNTMYVGGGRDAITNIQNPYIFKGSFAPNGQLY